MTPLRVGVIGTGIMGADHAAILHGAVSGATVTCLADLDLRRARSVAGGIPGATAIDDALTVITADDVDAVVIASHDSTHADYVLAALEAGKPVLCEKPLAPTLAECLRVAEGAGAVGAPLVSLGFMRRFDPGYAELKAAVRTGALGLPLLVHCSSRTVSGAPGATSEFSITGSAIHELDTVPWLLDAPIVEVTWLAPRSSSRVEGLQDPQLLLLRTADGVLTTVEVFLNAGYGYDIRCEVVGEAGAMSLVEPVRVHRDADRQRGIGYAADWRPRFADAYRLELQSWVDRILHDAPSPLATLRDGVVATAVAEAVIASMHAGGRPQRVEPPDLAHLP